VCHTKNIQILSEGKAVMSYGAYVESARIVEPQIEIAYQPPLPFEQQVGGAACWATQLEIDYSQTS
jgi:hypothetical protein